MIAKSDIEKYRDASRILLKGSDYLYAAPDVRLKPYISNYTITFPSERTISDRYAIIPNGSATLVFCLDGRRLVCDLFGSATKASTVGKQAKKFVMLLIVEFQPWGLYEITKIPQMELADRVVSLDSLGSVERQLQKGIFGAIEAADGIQQLLGELDRSFLSIIARQKTDLNAGAMLAASELIIKSSGMISARELSETMYYSERQLNRILNTQIGTSVKSFARLVRINKAARILQNPQAKISYAAEALGFYDPAHFTREFKRLCNVTPADYLENMSDFYNEISKF